MILWRRNKLPARAELLLLCFYKASSPGWDTKKCSLPEPCASKAPTWRSLFGGRSSASVVMQQPSAQATDELDKLLSSFLDPLNPLLTGQQGLGLQAFGDDVKAEKGADQGFGQMFSSAPQSLPLHFPQHSVFQAAPLPVPREQPPNLAAKNSDTFAWEAQLASLQQGLDFANTSGGQAAKGYTQSPESSGNSYGDDYSVRGGKGKGGGSGDANFREKHNQRNKEAQVVLLLSGCVGALSLLLTHVSPVTQRRFRQRQRDKMDELQARLDGLQAKKAEAQRRTKLLHSALTLRSVDSGHQTEKRCGTHDLMPVSDV